MTHAVRNIEAIVNGRICCGCGACAVICPKGAIEMREGRNWNFAEVAGERCVECGKCTQVCPSRGFVERAEGTEMQGTPREERAGSEGPGSVLSFDSCFCLGWAKDAEKKREGASGGFVTALVGGLLERGEIDGAVMVRADGQRALYNRAVVARTREEVMACRGSRYGPASTCTGLAEVARAQGRYAFVGKGCEVSALRRMQSVEAIFRERVVLAVGIFCAQTPARTRTRQLLGQHGVDAEAVEEISYRGAGWPGRFTASGGGRVLCEMDYSRAWGFLAGGLPAVRCFLCGDGAAREADISVGDPWGQAEAAKAGEGMSFAVLRGEAGRRAVEAAQAAGAVSIEEAPAEAGRRRMETQEGRGQSAARRLRAYGAIFGSAGILKWLLSGELEGARTLLRQRIRREYY